MPYTAGPIYLSTGQIRVGGGLWAAIRETGLSVIPAVGELLMEIGVKVTIGAFE